LFYLLVLPEVSERLLGGLLRLAAPLPRSRYDGPLRGFWVQGVPARRLVGRRQLLILTEQDIGWPSRL
jgi:hypothetical protein